MGRCFYPWRYSFNCRVQSHISTAMHIQECWLMEAVGALNLLDFYGPDGMHYKDSRVVDMIKSKVASRTLHLELVNLLRNIHQDFLHDHESIVLCCRIQNIIPVLTLQNTHWWVMRVMRGMWVIWIRIHLITAMIKIWSVPNPFIL